MKDVFPKLIGNALKSFYSPTSQEKGIRKVGANSAWIAPTCSAPSRSHPSHRRPNRPRVMPANARSGHAPGQKAADSYAIDSGHRPHHRLAETIRLGDHRVVGNVDPLSLHENAIMHLRFCDIGNDCPIWILDHDAVGETTAQAPAACEPVEPRFQGVI